MSPYVGASPESDAAWNRITFDIGDQMISESELVAIDKPNTVLKVTDPNTGIEGYRIGLEVFHQLHCLNLLRKVSYQEYYRPMGGDFADPPEKFRGHVGESDRILDVLDASRADIFRSLHRDAEDEFDVRKRHRSDYLSRSSWNG